MNFPDLSGNCPLLSLVNFDSKFCIARGRNSNLKMIFAVFCTMSYFTKHSTRLNQRWFLLQWSPSFPTVVLNLLLRGGSRIFFRRGCTRLLLYFNTNKPHTTHNNYFSMSSRSHRKVKPQQHFCKTFLNSSNLESNPILTKKIYIVENVLVFLNWTGKTLQSKYLLCSFFKLKSQIHKLTIFWIEIDQSQQKGQFLDNSYSGLEQS